MLGAGLGTGGSRPCLQGGDSLVGRTDTGQVRAHMIIAREGGRRDTLETEGDGSVHGIWGLDPSLLCQPALLFTIKCDLG